MDPMLAIDVRGVAEGIATLTIVGEMTRLAEQPLNAAFAEAIRLGAQDIILDFSGLTTMNNKGIGLLVRLLAQAESQRRQLVAVGLNEHYRRVFALTGLDEGFPIYGSQGEAIKALSGKG